MPVKVPDFFPTVHTHCNQLVNIFPHMLLGFASLTFVGAARIGSKKSAKLLSPSLPIHQSIISYIPVLRASTLQDLFRNLPL